MSTGKWMGRLPQNCDVCGKPLNQEEFFIDGKTKMGPWASMCCSCHQKIGKGLGMGKGQKYNAKTGDRVAD